MTLMIAGIRSQREGALDLVPCLVIPPFVEWHLQENSINGMPSVMHDWFATLLVLSEL